MRLGDTGYPLVILSHRGQEFLERTLRSLRFYGTGITTVVVVDDSGDRHHHEYLDTRNLGFTVTGNGTQNMGYLSAMQTVFDVATVMADRESVEYALLWEEDFFLTAPTNLHNLAAIMKRNETLAQLNLQRQAVYGVERRFGYLESHVRRGYNLTPQVTEGKPWVRRKRPFTTNPGLIRREALDMPWPGRIEAAFDAEGAMSRRYEQSGWDFGWYGKWNTPSTQHVGVERKSGVGY